MTSDPPTKWDSVPSSATQWVATRGRRIAVVALVCGTPFLAVGTPIWAQNPPATEQGASPSPAPPATSPSAQTPAPPGVSPPAPSDTTPSAAEPNPVAGTALLPRDLSAWGMFLNADIIVKAVMLGLAFASLVTWTVALAKGLELISAQRRLRSGLRILAQAPSLAEASRQLPARHAFAAIVDAASSEWRMSADTGDKEGVKERVASRLERIEAAAGRRMVRGTGLLATIGATAPFVGLFGTVWGIMNSFIGISKLHTTNLAVVAPGIAEALLATALGLVAAIPAVVIYNMFSRWIAGYRALYADGSAEVLRLTSRDLDRAVSPSAARRPPVYPAAE